MVGRTRNLKRLIPLHNEKVDTISLCEKAKQSAMLETHDGIKLIIGSMNQNMVIITNYYQLVYIGLPLTGVYE